NISKAYRDEWYRILGVDGFREGIEKAVKDNFAAVLVYGGGSYGQGCLVSLLASYKGSNQVVRIRGRDINRGTIGSILIKGNKDVEENLLHIAGIEEADHDKYIQLRNGLRNIITNGKRGHPIYDLVVVSCGSDNLACSGLEDSLYSPFRVEMKLNKLDINRDFDKVVRLLYKEKASREVGKKINGVFFCCGGFQEDSLFIPGEVYGKLLINKDWFSLERAVDNSTILDYYFEGIHTVSGDLTEGGGRGVLREHSIKSGGQEKGRKTFHIYRGMPVGEGNDRIPGGGLRKHSFGNQRIRVRRKFGPRK
ncbi:hypothetical protein KY358_01195, partial [Candidatus Woesearchaeota archaeon]|nr:hypothetical protein [Candidatus Woesearchaeota archaeon]